MVELSANIIFEILTRVSSLKTLDACKLVCKEWKELIYDSSFMPTYYKRTNNIYGCIVQQHRDIDFVSFNRSDKVCMKSLMPHYTKILASCNQGILLCMSNLNFEHYVYKPTTQEWQTLPDPKNGLCTVAAAITILQSSSYLRYKIVRLKLRRRSLNESRKVYYAYETFDSKLWTWCKQEEIILPHGEEIINTNPAVSANNYIHWLTYHDNVLGIHRTNSSSHKLELPKSVYKNDLYKCKQLSEYQRKLGFTCLTQEGNMELWILDDHKRWIKNMTINLEDIEKVVKFPYPLGFYNEDTALIKAYNEVVLYNVRDCSYNTVKMDGLTNETQFFLFRSDWESVNLLGPSIERARKTKSFVDKFFIGLSLFLLIFGLLCLLGWVIYDLIISF